MRTLTNYLHSNVTPGEAGDLLWATIYVLLVVAALSVAVMLMTWLERKILAHIQIRYGPMRVGPHGLLQPIADSLKLLLKEDIIPAGADKLVFWLAPVAVVMTAFTNVIKSFGSDILVALNLSLANSNSLFAAWKKLPIAVASWVSTTLRRMGRKSGLKSHARQENLLFLNV